MTTAQTDDPTCAGFMFISAIQKWRPNLNELADHLDINIIL